MQNVICSCVADCVARKGEYFIHRALEGPTVLRINTKILLMKKQKKNEAGPRRILKLTIWKVKGQNMGQFHF